MESESLKVSKLKQVKNSEGGSGRSKKSVIEKKPNQTKPTCLSDPSSLSFPPDLLSPGPTHPEAGEEFSTVSTGLEGWVTVP